MIFKKYIDYKLFFAVFLLIIFGMIMISSVSVYSSFRVTSLMVKSGTAEEAYNYFYVLRNISHVVFSCTILVIIAKIPYTYLEKYSKLFLALAITLLITVLIIWPSWNGAKWWITIPWIPFTIQPTEFVKLSLILFFAYFFKKRKHILHTLEWWLLPFLFVLWCIIWLVWLLPDFWTILVLVPISVILFFLAWANPKHIAVLFLIWSLFAFSIYQLGSYDKSDRSTRNKLSYITDRIDNFLSDNKESIKNKTINYQTEQALIAIGSGGFAGLGFWQSIQKFWYLPEVQWDFIFSVIVEELWFIGALTLVWMYLFIWYRGIIIASQVSDLYGKYIALWISSWILVQSFVNMWVNLNIVPLTWITLPFVSYWWSSLLSLLIGFGILLNISRYMEEKKSNFAAKRKKIFFLFSRNN